MSLFNCLENRLQVLSLQNRRHRRYLILQPPNLRDGIYRSLNVTADARAFPYGMDAELGDGYDPLPRQR